MAARKKKHLVSTLELSEELGVERSRIPQLIKKGLPVSCKQKVKGQPGPARNFFDLEAARLWVAGNNIRVGKAHNSLNSPNGGPRKKPKPKAKSATKKKTPPKKDVKPKPEIAPKITDGWLGALDRARKAEQLAHSRWAECMEPTEEYPYGDLAMAAAANKAWVSTLAELRRMETDAVKIEKARGESISMNEHHRICFESHALVADRLKTCAKKITQQVVGKKNVHEVLAITEKHIFASMRDLQKRLNEL